MNIPVDVPSHMHEQFLASYQSLTRGTHNLFMIAGDHRLEHLMDDFYALPSLDLMRPDHMFAIAQESNSALAVHPGLFARYAGQFKRIPYCTKMTGRTNRHDPQIDPLSVELGTVEGIDQIVDDANLVWSAVGMTCYIGGEFESEMLHQTATMIAEAHQYGKVAIVWMYPRGEAIQDAYDPMLLAGCASAAVSLGADFVKLELPETLPTDHELRVIVAAAGTTGVLLAGGHDHDFQTVHNRIQTVLKHGFRGAVVGRAIHTVSQKEALVRVSALQKLIYSVS